MEDKLTALSLEEALELVTSFDIIVSGYLDSEARQSLMDKVLEHVAYRLDVTLLINEDENGFVLDEDEDEDEEEEAEFDGLYIAT